MLGGVVIRYGQLYGPRTYYSDDLPAPPRIHVESAARRTMALLDAPSRIVVLTDEDDGGEQPRIVNPTNRRAATTHE